MDMPCFDKVMPLAFGDRNSRCVRPAVIGKRHPQGHMRASEISFGLSSKNDRSNRGREN